MWLIYLLAVLVAIPVAIKGLAFLLKKPVWAVYSAIFIAIIWPTIIAIKIDPLPGVTLERLAVFVMTLVFLIKLVSSYNPGYIFRQYKTPLLFLLVIPLWMLIAAIAESTSISASISAIFAWFVGGPIYFIAILMFFYKQEHIDKLLWIMFTGMIICNVLGVLEQVLQRPLFANYLVAVTEFTEAATIEVRRNEIYRLRSLFSNPLVYAQFLLVSIRLSGYLASQHRSFIVKRICNANLLVSYVLLYFTGSRAGLALGLLYPAFTVYEILLTRNDVLSKMIKRVIDFVVIPGVALMIFYNIYQSIEMALSLDYLVQNRLIDAETSSTLGRVLQIVLCFNGIIQQPLTGFGIGSPGLAMVIHPLDSIDNYYLLFLMGNGIVGILLLLGFLYHILGVCGKNIFRYRDEQTMVFFTSIMFILLYYLILSIPKANLLLYVFSALVLVRQHLLNSREQQHG